MNPEKKLLKWYDAHGRDLPWRKTREAYRILVSEIMLQQTQVGRVIFYYNKWLKTFPNWHALAGATTASVIRAWSGLGYNRRALMLRDIAKTIEAHGEPTSEEAWRALKGIGAYTAAALNVFVLRRLGLPIDTNIRRVGTRLWLGAPFPTYAHDAHLKKITLAFLMHEPRFADIPQALFDLATSVCTKTPACKRCPLRKDCLAAPKFFAGVVTIPKQSIKRSNESRHRNKPFPDRIYRGRILKLLQEHPRLDSQTLGPKVDPDFKSSLDQTWLLRMLNRMQKDRLINQDAQGFIHICQG